MGHQAEGHARTDEHDLQSKDFSPVVGSWISPLPHTSLQSLSPTGPAQGVFDDPETVARITAPAQWRPVTRRKGAVAGAPSKRVPLGALPRVPRHGARNSRPGASFPWCR